MKGSLVSYCETIIKRMVVLQSDFLNVKKKSRDTETLVLTEESVLHWCYITTTKIYSGSLRIRISFSVMNLKTSFLGI